MFLIPSLPVDLDLDVDLLVTQLHNLIGMMRVRREFYDLRDVDKVPLMIKGLGVDLLVLSYLRHHTLN